MKRVIIATNNAHKVSEISTALDFEGWEFATLAEAGVESNPVEDADTFVGNARIKARAAWRAMAQMHGRTGGPGGSAAASGAADADASEASGNDWAVIADDSGLEVDALGGEPGVFSSRYAGEDGNDAANNAKLLRELDGLPWEQRSARFVCTLVFIDSDGSETVAHGTIEGHIGYEEAGEGGFGYDPLFYPLEYAGEKTTAQVSQAEKNAISHRGNALRELRVLLEGQV